MAFTDAEKVDVRRYCGYSVFGAGPGDATFNRFNVQYEMIEYRLNNLTDPELAVARTYLVTLAGLETAISGATGNLDTDVAAVWTHNKNEVADRSALFDQWRMRFCGFFGVSPGPALKAQGGGFRYVV